MITTIIVEDEAPACARLKEMIEDHADFKVIETCSGGKEAIEKIERTKPQLVFLDVHLPDMSGLDVLKMLNYRPQIVFTTAFDKYAVNAFEHNAVDFLCKPFSRERFNKAMQKVMQQLNSPKIITGKLENLLASLRPTEEFLRRIPSKVAEKIYIINVEDICYFKSKDKVVTAHSFDNYFIVNYTLDELQTRLDPDHFYRIHRSTIVNINFVQTIEPLFGGTYLMKINDKNKTELNVSRNAGKSVREKLGW